MKKITKYSISLFAGIILFYATLIVIDVIPFRYEGDGKFVDYGITSMHQRYWLIFGNIDLTKKGRYEYAIGYLPHRALNFDLIMSKNSISAVDKISKTEIELIIKEDGLEAYRYKGKLFEDGYYNDEYYRKGLRQRLTKIKTRNNEQYFSWTLDDYSLKKYINILGDKAILPKRVKRTIILTIEKPSVSELDGTAELAIYGGSW